MDPPRTWVSYLIKSRWSERTIYNVKLETIHPNACSSYLDRRWHRRDGIVRFLKKKHHDFYNKPDSDVTSTITYDILVRAGVDTTSAFVPDLLSASGAESGFDPLAAKGSRGIYIVPDIVFELSLCGPVNPYSLFES